MGRKRVIFIRSNSVNPDPRIEKEANTLIGAGYNVTILAWDRSNKYNEKESYLQLRNGKVKIHRFGIPASYGGGLKRNLIPLFLFQLSIIKWLFKSRKKYEIIHACDFDTAYIASKCSRILNKKLIYDIFDFYVDAFGVPTKLKKMIKRMDYRVINSADGVIICTEKRREQIEGSKPKQLCVIHNSPSTLSIDDSNLYLNKDKIKLVYIGILQDHRLLKELANVIVNNPNLELHIGGFGKLETYFKNLALKYDNIKFYGKLEYRQTIQLEKNCDIMTAIYDPNIKNHYYAAPNKFYEALMLGKPIIMVKNTGMDEVIYENGIGEIIDYSEESLDAGIKNLIERKGDWDMISNNMKKIYNSNYKWEEMDKRLIELYEQIYIQ